MRRLRAPNGSATLVVLTAVLCLAYADARAQVGTSTTDPLKVAVYTVAPYAFVDAEGQLAGHSVRLWELVAAELKTSFKLTPVQKIEDVIGGLTSRAFNIGIGALTVTPGREQLVDFSYPTHPSGVTAAVQSPSGFVNATRALWSTLVDLLPLFLLLIGLITFAGFVTWKLDQRLAKSAPTSATTIRSFGEGVYWAAVTMTTVGYGDKAPITVMARLFTVAWIFIGVIVISIFSGTVTAKLTASQFAVQDGAETALRMKRLAAVKDSSGAEFLVQLNLTHAKYDTLDAAVSALAAGQIDAVFNSRGALVHLVATSFQNRIEVLNNDLTRGWMAFALPPESGGREALNQALLNVLNSRAWAAEREKIAREYSHSGRPAWSTF